MTALNDQRKYWNWSPNPGSALNQAHWEDTEVRSVDGTELTGEMEEADVFCICYLECMISIINLYFLHWPSEGVILWCTWWIEGLTKLKEVIANEATLQPLWAAQVLSTHHSYMPTTQGKYRNAIWGIMAWPMSCRSHRWDCNDCKSGVSAWWQNWWKTVDDQCLSVEANFIAPGSEGICQFSLSLLLFLSSSFILKATSLKNFRWHCTWKTKDFNFKYQCLSKCVCKWAVLKAPEETTLKGYFITILCP